MAQYEKRGYLLEEFRLFHLRSEGGEKVDYHYHEFCKILLLVSGQGAYVVDGQRYLLQPGDVVLMSPASAAFDQFKNFMVRGDYYKKLVMEL